MKQIRIRKSQRKKYTGSYRSEGKLKKQEEILKDFKEEFKNYLNK
jgi:hypothetical protein